jgi:hypothetical protein
MTSLRFGLALCLATAACSDESDTTDDDGNDDPGSVDAYLGDTPHLRVIGTVTGLELDLDAPGAEASDVTVLFCERNYAAGALEKVEVKHNFTFAGQAAELELTFEGPGAVGSFTIGTDVEVAEKVETADATEYENAATAGAVDIELFSGTPGGDGMIPDNEGGYGGWFDATLDDGGVLSGSFSALCGANDVG